jgi:hypothetical protein
MGTKYGLSLPWWEDKLTTFQKLSERKSVKLETFAFFPGTPQSSILVWFRSPVWVASLPHHPVWADSRKSLHKYSPEWLNPHSL